MSEYENWTDQDRELARRFNIWLDCPYRADGDNPVTLSIDFAHQDRWVTDPHRQPPISTALRTDQASFISVPLPSFDTGWQLCQWLRAVDVESLIEGALSGTAIAHWDTDVYGWAHNALALAALKDLAKIRDQSVDPADAGPKSCDCGCGGHRPWPWA